MNKTPRFHRVTDSELRTTKGGLTITIPGVITITTPLLPEIPLPIPELPGLPGLPGLP